SIILARSGLIDLDRLDEAFEMLHTTSPAAAIMASSDRARALMEERGEELLGRTIEIVAAAKHRLREIAGLQVIDASDPTKLVLALPGTGADGFAVEADLFAKGVRFEMADRDTLVPIVTLADTETSVGRLAELLELSIADRRGDPRPVAASTVLSPRDAYFARRERVAEERAVGRVAAETAAPYPPGIPALAPGERITAEILDGLRAEAAAGSRIAYCSDPTLQTLLVVAD